MLAPNLEKVRIYLRPGPTDMRKQINALAVLVEQELELDPFSEAVFLFCNCERRMLKALYWDANGFALWCKRLEKHRFPWPRSGEQVQTLEVEQLRMLLRGIDFFNAHERLHYRQVS